MLYVFYNEFDENKYADFVLKDLHNQKVRVVPCGLSLWIYKNRLTRILFNIGFYLRIPFFFNFMDDFKDICRNIKKSDSILIFGGGPGGRHEGRGALCYRRREFRAAHKVSVRREFAAETV